MTSSTRPSVVVFWFRRDLRLEDNAGLAAALAGSDPVLPLFIFDEEILGRLQDKQDRRVEFIHQTVCSMNAELREIGSALCVEHGRPVAVFEQLLRRFEIRGVYTNRDYEPAAVLRDEAVERLLRDHGGSLRSYKDQVIFEKREVAKDDGTPYTVFTPYSRKWKALLRPESLAPHACRSNCDKFFKWGGRAIPSLEALGFRGAGLEFPPPTVDEALIRKYAERRDFPAIHGTSRLGLHLRFGTVSVRGLVSLARKLSETWLNELIWREFFMQILWNFPHVMREPFRPEYKKIKWRHDEVEFEKWCRGQTGYPFVDAGMRELNATGFMHNRARMITASFLVKHLLIDWRWGEDYFARKLLDFELASNNGNWQWVAGCGCDAAPYFRVFNPDLQEKKFDPKREYVKHWVPEAGTLRYPEPIVDHTFARVRALRAYSGGLGKKAPEATREDG